MTDLTQIASIDNVFLALRTTHLGARVEVTDEDDRTYSISITSLFHEDGSGRSFMISGRAELIRTSKMRISGTAARRCEAYLCYKGGGRRGWIRFPD